MAVLLYEDEPLPERPTTSESARRVTLTPPTPEHCRRSMSARSSQRPVSPVRQMSKRMSNWEGLHSRLDCPSALYLTINPQLTILKARELYGGAPRPLSARHEFIKQAFLSDTEDWRSNAFIGNRKSDVSRMNIVSPEQSTYLTEASGRKMSYYRQKSLAKAVSYRAVLVKKDGTLADNQYCDQYLDKEEVRAELRRQHTQRRDVSEDPTVSACLSKSLSRAPDRTLVSSLTKSLRVRSGSASGAGQLRSAADSDAGFTTQTRTEDRGTARAVSRIMTRARTAKMSRPGAAVSFSGLHADYEDDSTVSETIGGAADVDTAQGTEQAPPTFDDL